MILVHTDFVTFTNLVQEHVIISLLLLHDPGHRLRPLNRLFITIGECRFSIWANRDMQ